MGSDTICTVRLWLRSVLDLPESASFWNSNFFVAGPRIGSGKDSVTRMRRDNTGSPPSSPSERLRRCGHGFVAQERCAVGHRDAPGKGAHSLAAMSKVCSGFALRRSSSADWPAAHFAKGEPHAAGLRFVALVRHFDGEFHRVALAQEARRIGLHHDVLGGDGVAVEKTSAQFLIMREGQEMPFRQRLRHGESYAHDAVGIGHQLRGRRTRSRSGFAAR